MNTDHEFDDLDELPESQASYEYTDPQVYAELQARPLSLKEISDAYLKWRRYYSHLRSEKDLEGFIRASHSNGAGFGGRLKQARESKFLTAETVAEKLNISANALKKIEAREESDSLPISKIREIAEALDCELLYAVVPKNRKRFSELIWEQVVGEALESRQLKVCNPFNKSGALAAVVVSPEKGLVAINEVSFKTRKKNSDKIET